MKNPFSLITSYSMVGLKKTDHPEADESGLKQSFEMTRVRNLQALSRMFKPKSLEK